MTYNHHRINTTTELGSFYLTPASTLSEQHFSRRQQLRSLSATPCPRRTPRPGQQGLPPSSLTPPGAARPGAPEHPGPGPGPGPFPPPGPARSALLTAAPMAAFRPSPGPTWYLPEQGRGQKGGRRASTHRPLLLPVLLPPPPLPPPPPCFSLPPSAEKMAAAGRERRAHRCALGSPLVLLGRRPATPAWPLRGWGWEGDAAGGCWPGGARLLNQSL